MLAGWCIHASWVVHRCKLGGAYMQASTVGLIAAGILPQRAQSFSYFSEDFLAVAVHICACIGCQHGTYVYMHIFCSRLAQLIVFPDSAQTLRFWEPVIIPTFATSLGLQSDVLNCDAFVKCFAHVIHGKSCNGSCYHSFHFNTCNAADVFRSIWYVHTHSHRHVQFCSCQHGNMAEALQLFVRERTLACLSHASIRQCPPCHCLHDQHCSMLMHRLGQRGSLRKKDSMAHRRKKTAWHSDCTCVPLCLCICFNVYTLLRGVKAELNTDFVQGDIMTQRNQLGCLLCPHDTCSRL